MKINDIEFNCELSDIITELQAQLNLQGIQLIQKVKDSGDDIMVQCPYHKDGQERRPSAGIRKSDGTFHCFTCGETHSLPEFISHCFGQDDVLGTWGWKWLLQNFGTVRVEERKDVELDMARNLRGDKRVSDSAGRVSEEELDSYRYFHPYMYKRGLTDEVIAKFDIGYDKNTDCITFPVRDTNGNCLFVARRAVHRKWFNYPAGAEKPLYGLYEISQCLIPPSEIIICESMLDALVFWVIGKCAVALNGTGSESQFEALRNLKCRKLILCTDMDDAGMKARQKIRKNVKNKIITEYILPEGRKDANDCTREELENLEEIF